MDSIYLPTENHHSMRSDCEVDNTTVIFVFSWRKRQWKELTTTTTKNHTTTTLNYSMLFHFRNACARTVLMYFDFEASNGLPLANLYQIWSLTNDNALNNVHTNYHNVTHKSAVLFCIQCFCMPLHEHVVGVTAIFVVVY